MTATSTALRAARRATLLAVVTGAAFAVYFQLSKGSPFVAANPYANDPFDAVGSIAVQFAAGIGILTLARAVRQTAHVQESYYDLHYTLRGDAVVLAAVAVTLLSDGLAILHDSAPLGASRWGAVLVSGLIVLAALTVASGLELRQARHYLKAAPPPEPASVRAREGMLAQAIEDVIALAWWVPMRALPPLRPLLARLDPVCWWDRWIPAALHPARHPWRFVAAVALGTAVALLTAQAVIEGPAPDLGRAMLVVGIFLAVELAAMLGGFALLGGYLGLRPPLRP